MKRAAVAAQMKMMTKMMNHQLAREGRPFYTDRPIEALSSVRHHLHAIPQQPLPVSHQPHQALHPPLEEASLLQLNQVV
jgi:hypothetical protein